MNFISNYIKENPTISLVLGFQLYRFLLFPCIYIRPYHTYKHVKNLNSLCHDYRLKLGNVLKCLNTKFLPISDYSLLDKIHINEFILICTTLISKNRIITNFHSAYFKCTLTI